MKKNKMMRTAAVLGIAALLSTSALSGTLAKYTTSVNSEDSARVATWGFNDTTLDLSDLFKTAYDTEESENVKSGETTGTDKDVIAPGTTNSATFSFKYSGAKSAPEVAYNFTVDTGDSTCAEAIKANKNIVWKLDNGTEGTWDDLIKSINNLSGNSDGTTTTKKYTPGQLPTGFGKDDSHTITWTWKFDDSASSNAKKYWVKTSDGTVVTTNPSEADGYTAMTQDQYDTYMGNKTTLDDVKLKITITATQID